MASSHRGSVLRPLTLAAAILLLLPAGPSSAADRTAGIVCESHEVPCEFNRRPVVRIMKGDSMEYARPDYNDASWNVISLPHNWSHLYPGYTGICWYRIRFTFPREAPRRAVGIALGEIIDADEAYFNGELIGSTGRITPRQSDYDRKRIYEIPQRLIRPGGDNVLALRVAGFYDINGATQGPFVIGRIDRLHRDMLAREFFDVFFVIIYLAVGVYFAMIFFKQRDEREYLAFSLFSLSTGIYLFLRTQVKYFITDDFILLKRIEYLDLFLIFIFLTEFLTYHFEKKHTLWHFIYPAIVLVCMPLVVLTHDIQRWHAMLITVIQPAWVFPIAYFFWVLIKEFRRDSDARYLLGSLVILFLVMVNDLLVSRGVYLFMRLSNYGFLFIVVGMGIIMRNRYVALSVALENVREKEGGGKGLPPGVQDRVEQVIAYLKEHVRERVTREDLAAAMGLHPDHLGKMFKRATGKTVNDYLNSLRIQEALRMITETDAGVTHIAFAVGFESLATFYRIFQKEIGESPAAYRERLKVG